MEGEFRPLGLQNKNSALDTASIPEAYGIGFWEIDLTDHKVYLSDVSRSLLTISETGITDYETLLNKFRPEDKVKFDKALKTGSEQKQNFSIKVRTILANKTILSRGIVIADQHGIPLSASGTFIDLTENAAGGIDTKNQVERSNNPGTELINDPLESAVMQAPIAMAVLSGSPVNIEFANSKMLSIWKIDGSVVGTRFYESVPDTKYKYSRERLQEILDTGELYVQTGVQISDGLTERNAGHYFDFTYSPFKNNSGVVAGIIVTAVDVTERIKAHELLLASEEKFKLLIEEVPVGISVFTGKEMIVELANEPMIGYWAKDRSVIGKPLQVAFPELVGQPFLQILDNLYHSGESYSATNAPVDILVDGVLKTYYFNFTYKPLLNKAGKVYSIIDMSLDVTAEVLAQKALAESEARLRSVIEAAPVAMALFVGRDLTIDMPNQAFIEKVGKGSNINGKPLREVMPELRNQAYLSILDEVFSSGKIYQDFGARVDIVQDGVVKKKYYNITYTPIFDHEQKVYAILDIEIDVTDKMIAQKEIEDSQLALLELFEQSPVAIAIIDKKDLIYKMANPYYGELVGRSPDQIIGKSLLEVMPELAGQHFDRLLYGVIKSGKAFKSPEEAIEIFREGRLQKIYVDISCQPQRDTDGNVSAILVVATDLTQQVLSRKRIEETESSLRGAIELADLGTWQIDLVSETIEFSPRLKQWFDIGDSEEVSVERLLMLVLPADRGKITEGFKTAIAYGSDDVYDIEYTLRIRGIDRIVHAQGKVFRDQKGNAVKIMGTVQDVTVQRQVKLALEIQVQERTEELATMNEELASINEEYVAINEELSESNNLLVQSNENLQQFAYVASHDLQEPLRKIQSFGNLITSRYGAELGDGVDYLQRMQMAAKRMSNLIEDLLMFSRISSKSERIESVNLNTVLKSVLTDLELVIQESGAVIQMDDLPVITGDVSQLGQLFQNLLSNAIKFSKKDMTPRIRISVTKLALTELPPSFVPAKSTRSYYQIAVTDNGIGFDQNYSDRIFQLFQRLHGRSEYSGTGIGLAICEKVAVNHGGTIMVKSQPGEGSTFSVILPMPL